VRLRRRAKDREPRLRILFATDLHGADLVFRKFLNAIDVYEADVAILGGDLTGKRIIPVVEGPDGYAAEVLGRTEVAHDEDELERVRRAIADSGQYPVTMTQEEHDRLTPEEIHQLFVDACHGQVRDWMERAAERLEPEGTPLFVTGGNDDYLSIERVLDEAPYVQNADGRIRELRPGLQMISTGYANQTPWHCPRDIDDADLAAKIEAMADELEDPAHAVFNLHVPPYGSGLDVCPKLDTSVYPPRPLSGQMAPAGSEAVREAILRHAPMLSVHGHIHESSGVQRLGRTTVVNPGSEYAQGVLRTAIIDLVEGDVKSAQLLTA
jgi:uncharacterized protein